MAARTAAEDMSVTGSRGSSPYSGVAINLDAQTPATPPITMPKPTTTATRQNEPDDTRGCGADRHADAYLCSTPIRGVRRHTVQA
jgi:hypothetical protein